MGTTPTTTPATGLVSATSATSLFSTVIAKVEAIGSELAADVKTELLTLLNEGKSAIAGTLQVLEPTLDTDITTLSGVIYTGLNTFVAARYGAAAGAAEAAITQPLISSVAANAKSIIDGWENAYVAELTAPPAVKPAA